MDFVQHRWVVFSTSIRQSWPFISVNERAVCSDGNFQIFYEHFLLFFPFQH